MHDGVTNPRSVLTNVLLLRAFLLSLAVSDNEKEVGNENVWAENGQHTSEKQHD